MIDTFLLCKVHSPTSDQPLILHINLVYYIPTPSITPEDHLLFIQARFYLIHKPLYILCPLSFKSNGPFRFLVPVFSREWRYYYHYRLQYPLPIWRALLFIYDSNHYSLVKTKRNMAVIITKNCSSY